MYNSSQTNIYTFALSQHQSRMHDTGFHSPQLLNTGQHLLCSWPLLIGLYQHALDYPDKSGRVLKS